MKYDLAIIGGGPAGYTAAFEAIEKGLNVILFEHGFIGGTCLNRGCIPTKFLAHVAEYNSQAEEMSSYGITVGTKIIDSKVMYRKKTEIIEQLRTGLLQRILQKKIVVVSKNACIVEQGTILAGNESYHTNNILIATGAVSAEPVVDNAITTDEILGMDYIPKSLKIIGGGVIAVELAHIYNSLGTDVTICIRGDRILRKFDKEISASLSQSFKKRGITILKNCKPEVMKENNAEVILSATGRIPNVQNVFSEKLGIKINDGIVTDSEGKTNINGIYAAGDVVSNSPQLAHVAMEQGRRAVRAIVGEKSVSQPAIVNCIYTKPEIATVGLSEAEAKEQGKTIVTGKQIMSTNARTLIATKERGFIKIIADVNTKTIIGAQLMCERASDIVAELALAINSRLTVDELLYSVRPHPSYCEAVTDAALALKGKLECSTNM